MMQECVIHKKMPGNPVKGAKHILIGYSFLSEALNQFLPSPFSFKCIQVIRLLYFYWAVKITIQFYLLTIVAMSFSRKKQYKVVTDIFIAIFALGINTAL